MAAIYLEATIRGAKVEGATLTLMLAPRIFLIRGSEQYTLVGTTAESWKKLEPLNLSSSEEITPTVYWSKVTGDLGVNVDDKLLFLLMGIGRTYRFKIETGVKPWVVAIETIDD